MRKTDDFMGRVFLSLWTIGGPIEGKVMELCSHSGKSKYGTITLDLAVEQVKKNISLEVCVCVRVCVRVCVCACVCVREEILECIYMYTMHTQLVVVYVTKGSYHNNIL